MTRLGLDGGFETLSQSRQFRGRAAGLLVRGVVLGVSESPTGVGQDYIPQVARVHCYTSLANAPSFILSNVLIPQHFGGLSKGEVWRPRPATRHFDGREYFPTDDPRTLDGDHVLIGYIDDNPSMPVILGSLPHRDQKNITAFEDSPEGRGYLKDSDKDTLLLNLKGCSIGVDAAGDILLDGRFGTSVDEPLQHERNAGNVKIRLHEDQTQTTRFVDSNNTEVASVVISNDTLTISFGGTTMSLTGNGNGTTLTLGGGTIPLVTAPRLEALYTQLALAVNAIQTNLISHTHPLIMTATGLPDPQTIALVAPIVPTVIPPWDPLIPTPNVLAHDDTP